LPLAALAPHPSPPLQAGEGTVCREGPDTRYMMIAAHAVAANATLITHDKAFALVPDGALAVDDWTKAV